MNSWTSVVMLIFQTLIDSKQFWNFLLFWGFNWWEELPKGGTKRESWGKKEMLMTFQVPRESHFYWRKLCTHIHLHPQRELIKTAFDHPIFIWWCITKHAKQIKKLDDDAKSGDCLNIHYFHNVKMLSWQEDNPSIGSLCFVLINQSSNPLDIHWNFWTCWENQLLQTRAYIEWIRG